MDLVSLSFQLRRGSLNYYINYLNFKDVRAEVIDNLFINIPVDLLSHFSLDELLQYFRNRGIKESVYLAARTDSIELMKYCLKNNYPINYLALHTASVRGKLEIVQALVEAGSNILDTDLILSIKNGNYEIFKYLYERYPNPDNQELLATSICGNHVEIVNYLLEITEPNNYIRRLAVRSGNVDIAQRVGVKSADVESISHVISKGHLEMVKFLNPRGISYVIDAALNGHREIFQYLRENSNYKIDWERILISRASCDNFTELKNIYKCGITVQTPDSLDSAVNRWNESMIKFLIDEGSPISLFAIKGIIRHGSDIIFRINNPEFDNQCLDIAISRQDPELVKMIVKSGIIPTDKDVISSMTYDITSITEFLLNHAKISNPLKVWGAAIRPDRYNVVDILARYLKIPNNIILVAASYRSTSSIRVLLKIGVNVPDDISEILHQYGIIYLEDAFYK